MPLLFLLMGKKIERHIQEREGGTLSWPRKEKRRGPSTGGKKIPRRVFERVSRRGPAIVYWRGKMTRSPSFFQKRRAVAGSGKEREIRSLEWRTPDLREVVGESETPFICIGKKKKKNLLESGLTGESPRGKVCAVILKTGGH